MKQIIITLICCFFFSLNSCTTRADNQLKETLREALETRNNIRTELNIKFSKFDVADVLVKDSIAYYQNKFTNEKEKKASDLEHQVKLYQKSVNELESKKYRDIVDDMLLSEQKGLLETSSKALASLEGWQPNYLDKYKERDENEVLAKMVTASFSFVNLKGVQQEIKDGKFLFSADGTKVLELFVGMNNN